MAAASIVFRRTNPHYSHLLHHAQQVSVSAAVISSRNGHPGSLYVSSGEKHAEEYCSMYDICGKRSDGKVLNCPYGSPSVKPNELFSARIQSLCPSISGNVCCTKTQFDTLRQQVQQVDGNFTVDGIDYFVSDASGEGLYDSCKEVKFGTMNTRALKFIGGGAKNIKEYDVAGSNFLR